MAPVGVQEEHAEEDRLVVPAEGEEHPSEAAVEVVRSEEAEARSWAAQAVHVKVVR